MRLGITWCLGIWLLFAPQIDAIFVSFLRLGWPRNETKAAADRELVVMQCIKNSVILAALLAGAAIAGQPHAAFAAIQDGNWSVLIVTEKGTCDRGYRYNVRVCLLYTSPSPRDRQKSR